MPTLTLPRQVAEMDFQTRRDLVKLELVALEVEAGQRYQVAQVRTEGLKVVIQRSDWYRILTYRRAYQPRQ